MCKYLSNFADPKTIEIGKVLALLQVHRPNIVTLSWPTMASNLFVIGAHVFCAFVGTYSSESCSNIRVQRAHSVR